MSEKVASADMSYDPAKRGYSVINEAPPIGERHKSGHVYTSPEVYELEKEKIFRHDWFNVGRVEEIEKPGDFLTFRIADEPILVVRTKDNQIKAMSNVCAPASCWTSAAHTPAAFTTTRADTSNVPPPCASSAVTPVARPSGPVRTPVTRA